MVHSFVLTFGIIFCNLEIVHSYGDVNIAEHDIRSKTTSCGRFNNISQNTFNIYLLK